MSLLDCARQALLLGIGLGAAGFVADGVPERHDFVAQRIGARFQLGQRHLGVGGIGVANGQHATIVAIQCYIMAPVTEDQDDGTARLAATLQGVREKRGRSANALADLSGVSRAMIGQIERLAHQERLYLFSNTRLVWRNFLLGQNYTDGVRLPIYFIMSCLV